MADVWKRAGRKAKPWVCDYLDANGKRHRVACETKEAAQALLVERTKEAREVGPSAEQHPDMIVSQYAQSWISGLAQSVKPATAKSYAWALRKHILPAFGRMKMRDLQPGFIRKFITEKQHSLKRNSAMQLRAVLSAMLGVALEDGGIITKNAAKQFVIRSPRGEVSREVEPERVLSADEIAALIGAARDTQERALLLMLARTGCRPGEAMGLKWSDPNFTTRKCLIERQIHKGVVGTTKTGRRRYVDLSQQLCLALRALKADRDREMLAGMMTRDNEWIFVQSGGQPLTDNHVRRIFDRAAKRAGISGHVPYDLRHSYASALLAQGESLTYVANQLGHSKPTTTLTHYAHWMRSADDRCRADILDTPDTGLAPLLGTIRENVSYLQGKSVENGFSVRKFHR
jgi:integrase